MDLALNDQQRLICHKIQPTNQFDYLISFAENLLGEFYSSAEIESVYFTAAADWASNFLKQYKWLLNPSTALSEIFDVIIQNHVFSTIVSYCWECGYDHAMELMMFSLILYWY